MKTEKNKITKRNPFLDLNSKNFSAGLISALLAITAPPILILKAASIGNFSNSQTILWVFSVCVFGGLYSIFIPLHYRIPIVGGHSIIGVAFLASVTAHFTYFELLGAYLFTGLLMLVIGCLKSFSKLISYVPKELISAMLAGIITNYMANFIVSISILPLVGGLSFLIYFIFIKWDILKIPPMIAALTTAFVLLIPTHSLNISNVERSFVMPELHFPSFNPLSFISVSIPLALIILSNDIAVGIGALEQNNYKPSTNKIIAFSGIFSMLTSLFGGQSANMGGMMSAICSDKEAGPKEQRYMGAVISGFILILFGFMSWKLVPFIQALPQAFVSLLVGFALLGVFTNSLYNSFSQPTLKLSAAVTFIIALSNITIYNISSPIWSLLIGTIVAKHVEKGRK